MVLEIIIVYSNDNKTRFKTALLILSQTTEPASLLLSLVQDIKIQK